MALPLVKPLNSNVVFRSFGVNALPNHLKTAYRFRREWMAALVDLRASYFRGLYAPGLPATLDVVNLAREAKVKWGMQVATQNTSTGEIAATVAAIAANAADRCQYIEGVNEPDWVRGTGTVPSGWQEKVVKQQKAIWDAVRSHSVLAQVPVLGPSLRDVSATERDYAQLAELGICNYLDQAAMHRYPNGRYPNQLLDERLGVISRTWGKSTWITETGYHTALKDTSGHKPVTEAVMGDYAPAAFLEAVDRGCRVAWFELLDAPNPTLDNREHHFGLYACDGTKDLPSSWRAKPAVAALRALLGSLADPGPGFNTAKVGLRIEPATSDVRATVTAKRNGQVTVHLRRAVDCWDHLRQAPIAVTAVPVRLETDASAQTVEVDHRVRSVVVI